MKTKRAELSESSENGLRHRYFKELQNLTDYEKISYREWKIKNEL